VLDRRDKFNLADRKAQYDAAEKVKTLFGDESALMDRILGLRASLMTNAKSLPPNDDSAKAISDFDNKVETVRKEIVATTEGGAITGEERLREHTDQLYGAILSYEGKPSVYQIARIGSLRRELEDANRDFQKLLTNELPKLNEQLKTKNHTEISPPPAKVALEDRDSDFGPETNSSGDRDLPAAGGTAALPVNFRLYH
jgi:uncharacterized membrane protein YgaE (UPF0421/DUF939 family)